MSPIAVDNSNILLLKVKRILKALLHFVEVLLWIGLTRLNAQSIVARRFTARQHAPQRLMNRATTT